MKRKKGHVLIDLTKSPYSVYGVGPVKGNPRRCLECGQTIKRGQTWEKSASAVDPRFGRFVVIRHSGRCPDEKKRAMFRKKLARKAHQEL